MTIVFNEIAVLAGIVTLLLASFWVGRRVGRGRDEDAPHLGVVQGATVGLLGLLIGFTFSGAVERFVMRQDIITHEANALGTSWLRGDLLPEANRDALRQTLRTYTERRIALFDATSKQAEASIQLELARLQSHVWRVAIEGVADRPALANLVLPPLNEVFDLLSSRNAVVRRHIPAEVLALLIACAMLTAMIVSFGNGRRAVSSQLPAIGLVLLIATVIWVTIDLDFPRLGLVRISDQPLKDVLESMNAAAKSSPA